MEAKKIRILTFCFTFFCNLKTRLFLWRNSLCACFYFIIDAERWDYRSEWSKLEKFTLCLFYFNNVGS